MKKIHFIMASVLTSALAITGATKSAQAEKLACVSNVLTASNQTPNAGTYPVGTLQFPSGAVQMITVIVKVLNNIGLVSNPYHENYVVIDGEKYPIEREGQPNEYTFSVTLPYSGSVPIAIYTEDGWSATVTVSATCEFAPAPTTTVPETTVPVTVPETVPEVATSAPVPTTVPTPPTVPVVEETPVPTTVPVAAAGPTPTVPVPVVRATLPETGLELTIAILASIVSLFGAVLLYLGRRKTTMVHVMK